MATTPGGISSTDPSSNQIFLSPLAFTLNMPKLKILVWEERREPVGEPDVEVIIPSYMSKWAPRMMRIMPKEARSDIWGDDFSLEDLDLDEMLREAIAAGESLLLEVKSRKGYVKIILED